jgi:drug/metabolite transporter (DMT)-like permease
MSLTFLQKAHGVDINMTFQNRLITFAPCCFLLLWSSGFIFLKIGLQHTDPFTFLTLRYVCVVVILCCALLWLRPAFPKTRREWLPLICVGLFLQAGYFTFTYFSIRHGVSAGSVALITSQQPIIVALLAPFLGEKVKFIHWLGLMLGVTGATTVILENTGLHTGSLAGLMFAVLALFSITLSTLTEKKYSQPIHPIMSNFVQYSIGLLITAPLAYATEPLQIHWSWSFIFSLTYLVLGASLLAISLLLMMIRRGEAFRVSALFFLVPPTTALIAYYALDETLSQLAIVGMALAVGGIYLVMGRAPKK